ncbi:hypothetical protein CPB86DRAFT_786851 [Serendipita vermifera]|nr:hypothetical protein CPB86DRAFT_786851 [Serendipita vermifera]
MCCPTGSTCTLEGSTCVQEGYFECSVYNFCCPFSYVCSLGPNREELCTPPDSNGSSTSVPGATNTRTSAVGPTTSATVANNGDDDDNDNSSSTTATRNNNSNNTPTSTNGATSPMLNPVTLLMIGAASIVITFL